MYKLYSKACVRLSGCYSEYISINSGVKQGGGNFIAVILQ